MPIWKGLVEGNPARRCHGGAAEVFRLMVEYAQGWRSVGGVKVPLTSYEILPVLSLT